jgi:hypothetical protein
MPKAPLQAVKDRFKDKAGLISAVKTLMTDDLWIDRVQADKGLDSVANKKLLHLHEVLTEVKTKFGSRGALIKSITTGHKRQKDADYAKSLERYPTPRLLEIYQASQKQAK